MARPKVVLYVDTVSPFGYIAYYIVRNSPVFTKYCDAQFVPVFLGGIMKACGNTAPINIKNKAQWSNQERLRWARYFSVPMKEDLPPTFPPLTLLTMRTLCALSIMDRDSPDRLSASLDALMHEHWAEHTPVHEEEHLRRVLGRVIGQEDADRAINLAATEGKELLRKNTDKALASGAFGLPWFVCTNTKGETEGFWGVDHLGQVIQFLGLEHPHVGGWRAVL